MLDALRAGCERYGVPGAQLGLLRDGRREVICAGVLEVGGDAPVEPSTPFQAGRTRCARCRRPDARRRARGLYGPAPITADGDDVVLTAAPMGIDGARHERAYGDTFLASGRPPGGMAIAFDGDLLYLGPFALPRAS